jgi:hypothetical protein
MKKPIAITLVFLCLGAFTWAQGTKTTLFDVVKSQQELEIMRQILGTTLSFVAQNIQKQQGATKSVNTPFGPYNIGVPYRLSNMNAFYLYGQGAVFVIPTSNLRSATVYGTLADTYKVQSELESEMRALSREMSAQARALERGVGSGTGAGVGGGVSGGVAGGVQAPPPPPQPPQPAQAKQPTAPTQPAQAGQSSPEELRKKVADAQERVRRSRADAEANRAKFLESLGEIKAFLIEALANHGDSLTTVKPNEYITLVIMLDDSMDWSIGSSDVAGGRARQEVVSVQKSWITDYKAGRLTLDAFKQKAIQYSE